ncbi:MAG: hypothetical protein FWD65_04140 [Coriobacteriia bacterium]|nr:hypothetical protein [Coriobacteriia bacterium]
MKPSGAHPARCCLGGIGAALATLMLATLALLFVPAAGATPVWGPWVIDATPTCTQPGKEHRIAAQGNGATEYAEIPVLGHNYVGVVTTKPTDTAAGIETFTCSRCGDTHTKPIPALGHDYQLTVMPPTDTEAGVKSYVCSRCGATYTEPGAPARGHDFGPWTVQTPSKVGMSGVEERVCRRCGYKETRKIAALPVVVAAPAKPVLNTYDYVFTGSGVALSGVFSVLCIPYFLAVLYLRRRRKMSARVQDLREMVARYYEFE